MRKHLVELGDSNFRKNSAWLLFSQIGNTAIGANADLSRRLPCDGHIPRQTSGGDIAAGLPVEAAGRKGVERYDRIAAQQHAIAEEYLARPRSASFSHAGACTGSREKDQSTVFLMYKYHLNMMRYSISSHRNFTRSRGTRSE